ncbi:MAG: hypothetical protein GF307_02290 [candidate division Zixibacteria bacterium]|nr:hypothetical protein [candidate division Zixibacteria bacterium]
MLLRLVDITLILLFGFISISSIEPRTNIRLPEAEYAEFDSQKRRAVEIIGIDNQGRILISEERYRVDRELLLPYLIQKREQFDSLRVKIRAERDAEIIDVKKVALLCDSLRIPKSIEVRMPEGSRR